MRKIEKFLNIFMCCLGTAFILWLFISWFQVIGNNMSTYEYHPYNFFSILNNMCKWEG